MSNGQSALVVGAGPTGLVIAHELARAGIQCRLIDRDAHRATQSRAIAIHSHTVESFERTETDMGDPPAVAEDVDGGDALPCRQKIVGKPHQLDTRYPYVLGVPQDETERILEEHVARLGVPPERNTELVELTPRHGSGVSARLRQGDRIEEIEADWVLGCDGMHSTVRDQLGVSFSGSTYPEHFVLADINVEGDLDHNEAQVWLRGAGALAFFPLPADRWRLIIANSPADWKGEPTLMQCQALVDERGPGGLRLADPRWTAVFRIHRREAGHFRRGRVFLAGDAAHVHSPVGGQGMNMGIQDAFNLAWKLALVIGQGVSPNLLDSYEAERKPVDEAVIRQTDRATRLVSLHGSVTRFLRDHLMSLATQIPALAEKIGEQISGLGIDYRHSPIVEDHAVGSDGPHAGDRAPDVLLEDMKRRVSMRLYDVVAERRCHLLLLVGGGAESAPVIPAAWRQSIAVRRVAAAGAAGGDLVDRSGEAMARYGSAATAYLIRPDGYVGFRCGAREVSTRLPHYLSKLLGSAAPVGSG
jgi:2-polyprenyl-6-methoxyphenol hydroxylase-like FAD-dependent oxidoreductase